MRASHCSCCFGNSSFTFQVSSFYGTRRHEDTKNEQKPDENIFSIKHPCFTRLYQKQFIGILQASLRLPMKLLLTALWAILYRKEKTGKTFAVTLMSYDDVSLNTMLLSRLQARNRTVLLKLYRIREEDERSHIIWISLFASI